MDNQIKLKVFGKEFIVNDGKTVRICGIRVFYLKNKPGDSSVEVNGVVFDNFSNAEKYLESQIAENFKSIQDLVPEIQNYLALKEII